MDVRSRPSLEVAPKNYCRVPTVLYSSGDILESDAFILYQGHYILYRSRNSKWTQDDYEKLLGFGIKDLFVMFESETHLNDFLDEKVSAALNNPKLPVKEKAKILYATSTDAIEGVMLKPDSPEKIRRSITFVKHCINYLATNRENFYELFKMAAKDFAEHTHALHVALYSITFAKQMGYRTSDDCLAIGLGALLHDIGKTKIDPKILQKKGRLTKSERTEMEKHCVYGFEIVSKHSQIPEISRQIILQHHERKNQKGYPKGLGDDVHIFSKIVAICDCFDSLTSDRHYEEPMRSLDAVKHMLTELKSEFDQSLLINFIRMLQD